MGLLVQPLVGKYSDRTWTRLGRRIPYLFLGSIIAILVMCMLPNAGNFGLAVGGAMIFGLVSLMLLDTSINMAMQPFKMMVGDIVNEEQKAKAYSIQSLLCNAGSFVGFLFPYFFTWIGISNVAPEGVIPDSVIYSFYVGAAILILCVLYTGFTVKEMPPQEYAKYNNIQTETSAQTPGLISLLKNAPKAFWQIGLVQFFCWFAFLYMWNYTTGGVAENVWGVDTSLKASTTTSEYQAAGDWTGVLFAVQSVGSILWAMALPLFKRTKVAYSVSLVLGAIGFAMCFFVHDQYMMFIPFLLIGCAWAAMLSMPFALLTNALSGTSSMGAYLGLFNCTICLPQIIAALLGGVIMTLVGGTQVMMLVVSGVCLLIGSLAVWGIRSKA
jgi:maltose/moltooligosaccharide transporter